jgi:hypothetical protein
MVNFGVISGATMAAMLAKGCSPAVRNQRGSFWKGSSRATE